MGCRKLVASKIVVQKKSIKLADRVGSAASGSEIVGWRLQAAGFVGTQAGMFRLLGRNCRGRGPPSGCMLKKGERGGTTREQGIHMIAPDVGTPEALVVEAAALGHAGAGIFSDGLLQSVYQYQGRFKGLGTAQQNVW